MCTDACGRRCALECAHCSTGHVPGHRSRTTGSGRCSLSASMTSWYASPDVSMSCSNRSQPPPRLAITVRRRRIAWRQLSRGAMAVITKSSKSKLRRLSRHTAEQLSRTACGDNAWSSGPRPQGNRSSKPPRHTESRRRFESSRHACQHSGPTRNAAQCVPTANSLSWLLSRVPRWVGKARQQDGPTRCD